VPETTNNFDAGLRFRSRNIVAQGSVWYTRFKNRLAQAFDIETDRTIFRNLGIVDKYGFDGSISYQVIPELQFYLYGSYLKSKIQEDVISGEVAGVPVFAPTAGKREGGAPIFTFGGRIQGQIGPLELGLQAKRTGPRYVNDVNLPVIVGGVEVHPAKVPAYTLVSVDARLPLEFIGLNDQTFLQLNITNLFDKRYVGGFGGTLLNNSAPFVQIGAPRAISGTIVVGF
jgi:iron complex outermembrane receptor protein